jgi:hypothetical protein
VGNTIEVTATVIPGAKPMEGSMEVIQITRLRRVSRGCAAAAPPPPSVPKPGMSGARKAVIAGVIVGGAGAGAAVYLTTRKSANKGTISP